MECEQVHWWTLSGLVGAFLDLILVYLLLSISTVAFFAMKLLRLVGIELPCPCHGHSRNGNISNCVKRVLVHLPLDRVSIVHASVRSKFPFHMNVLNRHGCELNLKLVRKENDNGHLEFEGEGSCMFSEKSLWTLEGQDSEHGLCLASGLLDLDEESGGFDVKGKGLTSQRPRSALQHPRRGSGDGEKSAFFTAIDSLNPVFQPTWPRIEVNEEISVPSSPQSSSFHGEAPTVISGDRALNSYDRNEGPNENGEKNAIRALEKALKEEQTAYATLYLELEKERSSAATAADEALAMISRLQAEKASIEMEARQFQRVIEEKFAYDAEEMDILTEILLRGEREKHLLEKEVEAYRQTED